MMYFLVVSLIYSFIRSRNLLRNSDESYYTWCFVYDVGSIKSLNATQKLAMSYSVTSDSSI